MKHAENERMLSIHFDSILELLEYEYNGVNYKRFYEYKSSNIRDENWLGPENKRSSDVINHALMGHSKLLERLNKMMADFQLDEDLHHTKDFIKKRKRVRVRGEYGDEIDIHAVNMGNLDKAFTSRKPIEIDKRINLVTLMIDVGGLNREDVMASLWRSVVAVILTRQLIQAGKSVKIITGSSTSNAYYSQGGKNLSTTITIKEYNQPLSMDRLAAMSHLGFHRVFSFMARCTADVMNFSKKLRTIDVGIGSSNTNLKYNAPATMDEELQAGHSKYVYLARAQSKAQARASLVEAYRQMKEFA